MKVGDEVERIYEAGSGVITKDAGECFYVDWGNLTSLIPKGWLKLKNSKEEPKGHQNASILMEIAKEAAINPEYWKEYEVKFYDEEMTIEWIVCRNESDLFYGLQNDINIRRKPRTIRIGNYDVPEPISAWRHNNIQSVLLISYNSAGDADLMLKALQKLLGAKQ